MLFLHSLLVYVILSLKELSTITVGGGGGG